MGVCVNINFLLATRFEQLVFKVTAHLEFGFAGIDFRYRQN